MAIIKRFSFDGSSLISFLLLMFAQLLTEFASDYANKYAFLLHIIRMNSKMINDFIARGLVIGKYKCFMLNANTEEIRVM